MVKVAGIQKGHRLRNYTRVIHHKCMGDGQNDMVRHALQFRRLDRNLAVIRPLQN